MSYKQLLIEYRALKKKPPYQGVLEADKLGAGVRAAHRNGVRLLLDAEALYKQKRYPSAVSLALLSMEEFGKELMLRDMYRDRNSEKVGFYWMALRNHRSKAAVGMISQFLASGVRDERLLLPRAFDQSANYAEIINWLKETVNYVECIETGKWQEPYQVISKRYAELILEDARRFEEYNKPTQFDGGKESAEAAG